MKIVWYVLSFQFSSFQFSCSVVSDSLWPHGLQHARPPCPSPTFRVYSNSCPVSRWCHPTISSSVVAFSSCPQSLPASGSFQISQLFVFYDSLDRICLMCCQWDIWRRKWQPTPVFLPGESQGREAWWAAVYGVAQSRTRLKWLSNNEISFLRNDDKVSR